MKDAIDRNDHPCVQVTNEVAVTEPVSPLLISSFLELAFGRSDLISAELLMDRGFEMGEEYTLNNGGGWCERIKPRLEDEDWWHSGYEEHRWRLIRCLDDTTSEFRRITGEWPAPPNGKYYGYLENKSDSASISLAQDGIWVNAGVEYQFSGWLCDATMFSPVQISDHPVLVEIGLYPEGKLDGQPLTSATINVDATTCRKFTTTLPATSYMGRATFALSIPPASKLAFDMLSLMPSTNIGGFRKEVIDCMKNEVPVAMIRFPGGCFASTYHWRNGIGDRDTRPVDFEHWWNFPFQNDIGTVEFLDLCNVLGTEPMICVPVMFDDAFNAADWVAFCNTNKHPLHEKAGVKRAPKKVIYWELDNETYRRMDAFTYAHRCVEFSRAMKKVDPSIKIIMNCYWVYHESLREMLAIAGEDIDFVNNRGGDIAELRGDMAILAEYNAQHKRDIGLCHSEYRANSYDLPTGSDGDEQSDDGLNAPKATEEKDSAIAKASRWSYGLSVLCDFLEYQYFGGGFRFANFTGYNDGWGESLFNSSKSKVYPSPTGLALRFLQRQEMAWPLVVTVTRNEPSLRTQVAWDRKKKSLILFALNLSDHLQDLSFDLTGLGCTFKDLADVESLSAPGSNVVIKEEEANPIHHESERLRLDSQVVTVQLRPFSATSVKIMTR